MRRWMIPAVVAVGHFTATLLCFMAAAVLGFGRTHDGNPTPPWLDETLWTLGRFLAGPAWWAVSPDSDSSNLRFAAALGMVSLAWGSVAHGLLRARSSLRSEPPRATTTAG